MGYPEVPGTLCSVRSAGNLAPKSPMVVLSHTIGDLRFCSVRRDQIGRTFQYDSTAAKSIAVRVVSV